MSIRSLRSAHIAIVVVWLAATAAGQQAPVGYDDTPMQPNGKWHIHDGKRPQPAIVTPGPANVGPVPAPGAIRNPELSSLYQSS